MFYFMASIMAIVGSIVFMFTKFEVDYTAIQSEVKQMKRMISFIDKAVDEYIEEGNSLDTVNFEQLKTRNLILGNSTLSGVSLNSKLQFKGSEVVWQLIPNISDSSSYKLLIDMHLEAVLMRKSVFAEMFIGDRYCEKLSFGDFDTYINTFDEGTSDFVNINGTNSDGIIQCTIYK
ncbi:MAG: hypothetical protein U9Q33_11160 [Campylobacterota bacterium]|nr:hypothetical protein [Campylobacterota bacterium]